MRAGKVLQERVRGVLQGGSLAAIENDPISNYAEGPVVYWMSRDQRSEDNWALLFARDLAAAGNVPLVTVFNLVPSFLEATERQYDFMLKGLQETERNLREKNISFYLLRGQPRHTVPLFVLSRKASALVTDFSPLRIAKDWRKQVRHQIDSLPMFVVDAHNCIPVWEASDKQESAARTFRAKAKKLEGKFLTEFPDLQPNAAQFPLSPPVDWSDVFQSLQIDRTVKPVDWVVPGSEAGNKVLNKFCTEKLKAYSNKRNNPTVDALSNLSPYFHFGQLAPHRAIMEVKKYAAAHKDCAYSARKWIDETFIFHELTDNYCFYNDNYDNINGAPVWARDTLVAHNKDPREYVYSLQELENGKTHSQFWNAMQMQLVKEGKLHAWCRMQWAKGILEWTNSAEEALDIAIYLNDKYNIDGRDPNGYVGCMWCICGLHDRPFPEREIFGKIRYKNANSQRRRFNQDLYIRKHMNDDRATNVLGKRSITEYFPPSKIAKKE